MKECVHARTNEWELGVGPELAAGSGVAVSLCEVQDAVEPRKQGEQDGVSERGLGRVNKSPRGPRGRTEHEALKAQGELQLCGS